MEEERQARCHHVLQMLWRSCLVSLMLKWAWQILDQVKNKAAFLSGICHRFRDQQAKATRQKAKAEKQEIQAIKKDEVPASLPSCFDV
eukprot:767869-Hanusia_phi.AAC.9